MSWNCFGSADPETQKSKDLQKNINKWYKDYEKAIKILLLGAGESGKSTILKQMKILHINGFSESERREKSTEIRRNLLQALRELIDIMPKLHPPATLENTENQKGVDYLTKLNLETISEFPDEFYNHAISLWNDRGIQDCLVRDHEFPLMDCTKYFFSKIDDLRKKTYVPSDQDILQSRKRTPDIQKIEFTLKVPIQFGGGSQRFWMFDVGGQRGERKKWIQVFEGITAILFLIACSNFDSHIREDYETNTLKESLDLFDKIWNSRYLTDSGIILFLNKQDLLEEKIKTGASISRYFEDYANYKVNSKDGAENNEYVKTRCFIRDKFLNIAKTTKKDKSNYVMAADKLKSDRQCYWHFTIATDTKNIKRVFGDVHSMIVTWNLKQITLA